VRGIIDSEALARSGFEDVPSLRALLTLLDLELDALAFGQALEAMTLDGGEMHEHIVTTVILGDEAKALFIVKPFY